jgi:putative Mn2+ efflux pump MntP
MLIFGWSFGFFISDYIGDKTKYVAAGLLIVIGANMAREALHGGEGENLLSLHTWSGMLLIGLATSIDALAVGVSYGVIHNNILSLVLITVPIMLITTATAFWLGGKINEIFGKQAEICGGAALILIGFSFLL